MAIKCPSCGEAERHAKVRHKKILTFDDYLFGLIGGLIGILIWHSSLESKFQCEKCGRIFIARSIVAKVFHVISRAVTLAFMLVAGLFIYLIVFSKRP